VDMPRVDRDLKQENRDLRARMIWMEGELSRLQRTAWESQLTSLLAVVGSLSLIYLAGFAIDQLLPR
jgi:hypothetical protein